MGIMTVDTSVGDKAEKMQRRIVFFTVLNCLQKFRDSKEISVFDRFCNSGQFLIYDTACTHVQMSHLGITHLTVRKTHGKAAGIASHVRTLAH